MAKRYEKDIRERAFKVAATVFKLYPRIESCGAGHALVAHELLKTAGSMAANLEESAAPSSRKDMAAKYAIALREGRETRMWARLLAVDAKWLPTMEPLIAELGELVAMMNASVTRLRGPAIDRDGDEDSATGADPNPGAGPDS